MMNNFKNDWKINYNIPEIPEPLSGAGYAPLLASILVVRGITSPSRAEKDYYCGRESILDPFGILNMKKAADRIMLAIESLEKIAVYGDYDVDGITSTCLLTDYLRCKGLEVLPYIPDRSEEGYGLNCKALDFFSQKGITLVITVDCGITATVEAAYAEQLGIDIIVTDHHECRSGEVPEVFTVVNCRQPGDSYENVGLAGVGITFKLVCACEGDTDTILQRYADLVAIGTIADVMPLIGENRYIAMYGLEMLRKSPRPGIAAVMKQAGIRQDAISAASIGYSIAPRLNAAGRISRALFAGELIMCTEPDKAANLAAELCEMNRVRQDIENEIWKETAKLIDPQKIDGPIVLASDRWHQGVIGIAASRLAEHFGIPAIMINLNGELGKGSCRSYGGFNLFEALSACSEHLVSFGGHALAAGLNIRADRIDDFRDSLRAYYVGHKPEPQPELICDLLISDIEMLSAENIRSLSTLEPYGNRNPKPVLCMLDVKIERVQNAGNGKNLKLIINAFGLRFNCIFFGHSLRDFRLRENDTVDIAFNPQISEFRGTLSTQLQLMGVRKHMPYELCRNILEDGCTFYKIARRYRPERKDFIIVWNMLLRTERLGISLDSILKSCPAGMAPEKYCICLEVFREAGLLSGNTVYDAEKMKPSDKADLESTPLMRKLK